MGAATMVVTLGTKAKRREKMSHKENDKHIDNLLDYLVEERERLEIFSDEELAEYTTMSRDQLIEMMATHEEHHREHHENYDEMQQWKDTVREIFDYCTVNSGPLKGLYIIKEILEIIADKHYDYFYTEGKK
jgi:hypothetical protein